MRDVTSNGDTRANDVRRVLIVDFDARRAAATASDLDRQIGTLDVEVAASGADALSRMFFEPWPGIALIERDMPDVDGLALAREIRARRNGATRTIVVAEDAVPSATRGACDAYLIDRDGDSRGTIAALAVSLLA